ncbi:MAG: hypothetical protein QF781_09345, partial [Phycisphaerales bacterium]|nr:hypothetical protein [Phycisphaerales bacterium]
MAKAYTPGLLVTRHKKHRCIRRLPIEGDVKVAVGDRVVADDIVAETALPGDVNPINLSNMMSLPPKDVIDCMLKKEGDLIRGRVVRKIKGGLLLDAGVPIFLPASQISIRRTG